MAAAAVTMLAAVALAAAGPAGPTTRPATHKSNPKLAGLAPNTVLDLGPLKLTPPPADPGNARIGSVTLTYHGEAGASLKTAAGR